MVNYDRIRNDTAWEKAFDSRLERMIMRD
jgi:hypothetical protein